MPSCKVSLREGGKPGLAPSTRSMKWPIEVAKSDGEAQFILWVVRNMLQRLQAKLPSVLQVCGCEFGFDCDGKEQFQHLFQPIAG
jgi:hypothetical protein